MRINRSSWQIAQLTRILDHTHNLKHWTILATFYATALEVADIFRQHGQEFLDRWRQRMIEELQLRSIAKDGRMPRGVELPRSGLVQVGLSGKCRGVGLECCHSGLRMGNPGTARRLILEPPGDDGKVPPHLWSFPTIHIESIAAPTSLLKSGGWWEPRVDPLSEIAVFLANTAFRGSLASRRECGELPLRLPSRSA